jgi:hypothetical protein
VATVDYRAKQKTLMRQTVADEAAHHDWTYLAARPRPVPPSWKPGQHVIGDCSKGCQFIDRWSGNPNDPMHMDYGPYGNSQTIWMHCQHLAHPSDLKVGDFVTFGYDGSEHAAKVYETGNDPLLWSFGHQGAPNFYRLSWDRRPHQLCRNPVPKYTPTPDQILRAKTGWFAWMQWLNGTGDWHKKGKKNKHVRPNIPRRIPLRWWKRRIQYHLRRHRGTRMSAATPTSEPPADS